LRNFTKRDVMDSFTYPAASYDIRYTTNLTLSESTFNDAIRLNNSEVLADDDDTSVNLDPVEANMHFSVRLSVRELKTEEGQYVKFAMKAIDAANNTSPISNVARVLLIADETGLNGGEIAGIVIGSVLAVFLLIVTIYFIATKTSCCGGGGGGGGSGGDNSYELDHDFTEDDRRKSVGSDGSSRRSSMEMKGVKTQD
jgi:hypothetical protein